MEMGWESDSGSILNLIPITLEDQQQFLFPLVWLNETTLFLT